MVTKKWLTYAWMLYRMRRPYSEGAVGWFDDALWKECCDAARRE